jgi:hypothetical protein
MNAYWPCAQITASNAHVQCLPSSHISQHKGTTKSWRQTGHRIEMWFGAVALDIEWGPFVWNSAKKQITHGERLHTTVECSSPRSKRYSSDPSMSRRPLLFVSGCQHVGSGHTLNFLSSPAGIAVVVTVFSRKPFTKLISGNGWQEEAVFTSTCQFWLKGNIKKNSLLAQKCEILL